MAKKKKSKKKKSSSNYNKIYLQEWECEDCGFTQAYETVKCPICSSESVNKI